MALCRPSSRSYSAAVHCFRYIASTLFALVAGCGGPALGSPENPYAEGRAPWQTDWRECVRGNADTCLNAAAWFGSEKEMWPGEVEYGPEPDAERTTSALTTACGAGKQDACEWLVGRELGEGPNAESLPAKDKLSQDCKTGDALSCVLAANALAPRAPRKAASLYKRACKGEQAEGCFHLARLHYNGQVVRRNKKRARDYFKQSCELDAQNGCLQYARMLKNGEGGRSSKSKAREMFKRACESDLSKSEYGPNRGWPPSCIEHDRLK